MSSSDRRRATFQGLGPAKMRFVNRKWVSDGDGCIAYDDREG